MEDIMDQLQRCSLIDTDESLTIILRPKKSLYMLYGVVFFFFFFYLIGNDIITSITKGTSIPDYFYYLVLPVVLLVPLSFGLVVLLWSIFGFTAFRTCILKSNHICAGFGARGGFNLKSIDFSSL